MIKRKKLGFDFRGSFVKRGRERDRQTNREMEREQERGDIM